MGVFPRNSKYMRYVDKRCENWIDRQKQALYYLNHTRSKRSFS